MTPAHAPRQAAVAAPLRDLRRVEAFDLASGLCPRSPSGVYAPEVGILFSTVNRFWVALFVWAHTGPKRFETVCGAGRGGAAADGAAALELRRVRDRRRPRARRGRRLRRGILRGLVVWLRVCIHRGRDAQLQREFI